MSTGTLGFADEVVTHARVRTFELPDGTGTFGLITLDNDRDHTRPSTFGPEGLRSLADAVDQVSAIPGIVGLGVTGKPFIFAVGADISALGTVGDRTLIEQFARLGHDVLRKFGELPFPTFAFVNGAAMGGGMELALHCTYRTVSTGATGLALPEVFLGLVPGWGGCYLLPHLIGPEKALQVMVSNPMNLNKQLIPAAMVDLGMADALFQPSEFLERSVAWAADVISGRVTVARPSVDTDAWQAIVDAGRAAVDARIHGAAPAPYRTLDLVAAARSRTRDEGFAAEDEAIADLVMGDEMRASIYAFDLVQRRAKKPAGAPDPALARPVTKVGIVGAGLMASQLALLFVRRLEVPVVMSDLDQERVDKGVGYVRAEIEKLKSKGRISADKANRLSALVRGQVGLEGFAGCDFIIEAVFEEISLKQRIFAELETIVSSECVLASNTSTLSVTQMAQGLEHPERVVGFHFFNPVAVMQLLEIARTPATDEATLATAFAVGKSLKKSCVLVKDAPGFVVNRLLIRFLSEIARAVDEGSSFEDADASMEPLGLPMSPFVLISLVGLGVASHVTHAMHDAFPDRFYASENLDRLATSGRPGVWTWAADGSKSLDPEAVALFQQGNSPSTPEEIRSRVLDALADECQRMLDEGVVGQVQDIDLCMILGTGWPFWLGGLTPYLDRTGVSEQVTGKRFLSPGVASVPR
ncbi:MAG: 3-hydroxyacyl-CoA dehydrogenase [Actinobacteria bacterium]|nr:3-hydroxyacyl-CoA dehydrogenase [Actinomycetota bacterium]